MNRRLREKRWSKTVTTFGVLCLSMMLLMPRQAPAQVTEEWVAGYTGPGYYFDYSAHDDDGVAVDDLGNVYVTGKSYRTATSYDYVTVKYDPAGNKVWEDVYDCSGGYDEAYAIEVDGSGNVYVTGVCSTSPGGPTDYTTIKYNSSGGREWVAQYNGPGNSNDYAYDIAVDPAGNVYVTGESRGFITAQDFATVKYDADGIEQWVAIYHSGSDIARAIYVDPSGNVYVTGQSTGAGTGSDFATVKYNSSGGEEWVARYNAPGSGTDIPYAMAVDSSGDVHVTGRSDVSGDPVDWSDYSTVKYDGSTGTKLWDVRYNGPVSGPDIARAIAVDAAGNVYITGESDGTGGPGGTSYDATTVKYDALGSQQWVARYNGPSGAYDRTRSIALDAAGNVYVTGDSYSAYGSGFDFITLKYSPTGTEMWSALYNGPQNGTDLARSIVLDAGGNVYVTGDGYYSDSITTDIITVKYSQDQDSDGDGVLDSLDNSPDVYNPSQTDIDSDTVGDASDNCPWNTPNPGQENTGGDPLLGDACEDHYSETANLLDATFKSPGDPIEVEACFTYSGPFVSILTFPPDCYNTTFELYYSGGARVSDTNRKYRIRKAYGIPPDLVTILQGETRCVTCDMRDLFHPSVFDTPPGTSIDFTGNAIFANYVTDPDFDPVTGLCTDGSPPNCPIDPNSCCDVWIGAVSSSQFSWTVANPITVLIDIKPGASPNVINLGSNGNVPVAILSTEAFDATTVDPYTITLSGSTVKVKGKAETPMASPEDVNGDGLMDLVVHVLTQGLQLTDTAEVAILKGYTTSGVPIQGSDTVEVKQ